MTETGIDIIEQDIFEKDPVVLERLLWDHSRNKSKELESEFNPDGHHHIYWATDNYEKEGFGFFDEITIESITGNYRKLVRPRADKSKEEQERRTKEKAEVFTPSWVCNAQNNLIDEAWFGRKDVFNHENDDHSWTPVDEPITFPKGKTWQDYVWDKRLEIACGEAPYLASRYDATTGEPIEDLRMRIGLLDRKLRVIGENVTTNSEWIHWAKCAVKSTYGFEWQGDNLLLAREAILYTIKDYHNEFALKHNERQLRADTIRTFAYIISWNIFQMDGITYTLPRSGEKENPKQGNLFEDIVTEEIESPIQKEKVYAKVAEWQNDGEANHKVYEFRKIMNQ